LDMSTGEAGAQGVPPMPQEKPTILVVDDYAVSRRLMEMLLKDMGCQTTIVRSGAEALEAVREQRFHFAFLDLQMPEMDGYETARAIREQMGDKAPVLVACSADDSPAVRELCLQSGFSEVLPKPVSPDVLHSVIDGCQGECDHPAYAGAPQSWAMPEGLASLVELTGKAKVAELLTLFVKESERRVDLLLKTMQEHNWKEFTRTAHSMKGASAQMGAMPMSKYSSELEQQGAAGERIRIKTIVDLTKELERVRAAIDEYLKN